jgi:hypothetical protein
MIPICEKPVVRLNVHALIITERRQKSLTSPMALSGAGGENRTLIACLEGRHISHYTTPACYKIITDFSV